MRIFLLFIAFLTVWSFSVCTVMASSELDEDGVIRNFGTIQEIANSIPFGDETFKVAGSVKRYKAAKHEIIRLLRIPGNFPTGYLYGRFERETRSFQTVKRAVVNDVYDASKAGQVIEATVDNAYEVNIYVPSKRGMFSGNNDAYVHNCTLSWTEPLSQRRREQSHDISAWIRRGTNKNISLPEVGQNVHVQVRCAAKPRRGGRTLINLQVAVPDIVDDEENPNYDVISRLKSLGSLPVNETERIQFIETLQCIMADVKGVEIVEENDGKGYELRRKLEYVKFLLGGREDDIVRAREELSLIIDEFCGEPE